MAWRDEVLRQQHKRQRLEWAGVVRQTLLEKRGAAKLSPLCCQASQATMRSSVMAQHSTVYVWDLAVRV